MTTTYRNPWFKTSSGCDPEFYTTEAVGVACGEYMVYKRIPGPPGKCCFDFVKDGVCLHQRAGFNGTIPSDGSFRLIEKIKLEMMDEATTQGVLL